MYRSGYCHWLVGGDKDHWSAIATDQLQFGHKSPFDTDLHFGLYSDSDHWNGHAHTGPTPLHTVLQHHWDVHKPIPEFETYKSIYVGKLSSQWLLWKMVSSVRAAISAACKSGGVVSGKVQERRKVTLIQLVWEPRPARHHPATGYNGLGEL